jgi:hypothetical protein
MTGLAVICSTIEGGAREAAMSGNRRRFGCFMTKMAYHQDKCHFERVMVCMMLPDAYRCDLCGCVRCRRKVEACSPTEEENGPHQHPAYILTFTIYVVCIW